MRKVKTISVSLPQEAIVLLDEMAEKSNRSRSKLLSILILNAKYGKDGIGNGKETR